MGPPGDPRVIFGAKSMFVDPPTLGSMFEIFFEILGFVFACFFKRPPEQHFIDFVSDLWYLFESICRGFRSRVAIVIFATSPMYNHRFEGSGASEFESFWHAVSRSLPGVNFSDLFMYLWVAGPSV